VTEPEEKSMELPKAVGKPDHRVAFERSPKRMRVIVADTTIADTLQPSLLFETGYRPVYYFPRPDVRMDLLERTEHHTHCPYKGDASYWTIKAGDRRVVNAVWSYEQPINEMASIKDYLAFYWDKVDHWIEEDEEIFGHARDPYARVDVRPSSREVRVTFNGEVVAQTQRGMFLFETGHPTRYYIPQQDVRMEFLTRSDRSTVCPYKGTASYWSLRVGGRVAEDAVWAYLDPLPDCPRIAGYLCFYPEKVDRIEVEGKAQ
jgi:uncharacterized protein (DUF427 family)